MMVFLASSVERRRAYVFEEGKIRKFILIDLILLDYPSFISQSFEDIPSACISSNSIYSFSGKCKNFFCFSFNIHLSCRDSLIHSRC